MKRGPEMIQYHLEKKGPEQPKDQTSVQSLGPDSLQQLEQQNDVEMDHTQRSRSEQPQHQGKLNVLGAVALEQWHRHFLNDHMPSRRACSHCVRAQGRSKPHRKA